MNLKYIMRMTSDFLEFPVLAAADERFVPSFTTMALPVSVAFLCLAAWAIHKGGISFGQPGRGAFIKRSKRPVAYWLVVLGLVLIALVLVFFAGASMHKTH